MTKSNGDGKPKPKPDSGKHLCVVCGKPAAVIEQASSTHPLKNDQMAYLCYEHHMDNCSALSIEDMKAGKKRGGIF